MNLLLEIGGWAGSALVVWSLTQARVLRFRWLNLTGSTLATAYNAILGIWPFVAMNGVIVLINIYWLIRLNRERHDGSTYTVVEVAPDDAYLLHVLRVHADDIAQHAPRFRAEPGDGESRHAFLVQRGDETVGVVEVLDVGDGVGAVLLDWVSLRFRDFTPGEFVWEESGALAGTELREVVRPALGARAGVARADGGPGAELGAPALAGQEAGRGEAAYLERVGFTSDGVAWSRRIGA
ncbi:hypothetical protein [Myceligenerans xiligouense]|uniref:Inner membrane protein n=1 Tax=Myceligenerans xiligouense TaxID=253184 RepID=A0A3N4ZHY3_9MICO|nr:hypothetical protein [Myceligenerans xiligouense]RPF19511.1 hypothetical protein EDD34_0060 [Myceligenerans xiligouense]